MTKTDIAELITWERFCNNLAPNMFSSYETLTSTPVDLSRTDRHR